MTTKGKKMKLCFLLSTILLVALSVVAADNLYPACGSLEQKAVASSGETVTVVEFYEKVSTVLLYCFAYEVTSVHKEGYNDECAVAHQTEYPFRLALRGTYQNESYQSVTQDFEIKDYMGGSIDAISMFLPKISTISIVFTNLGTNPRCKLQIREIHDFKGSRKTNANDVLSRPVLVATYPRTIATEENTRSHFILRYASEAYAAQAAQAQLTMVKFTENCSSAARVHTLDPNPRLPDGATISDKAELYKSFSTTFFSHHTTTYVMCYRNRTGADAVAVAAVTVYSGNPSYYEFVSGMDDAGHVYDNVPVVAKFHGHDLDTRQNGDRAKLVNDNEECGEGKPAGGVPEATDLGPSDDFGPNTTYTLWTFTVLFPGAYKVCYLRANALHWTEVPYITDVGPGRRQTNTTKEPAPAPHDPETNQVCPTAPPLARRAFKTVQLTLRADSVPGGFIPSLAKMLCLSPESIRIAHTTKNKEGRIVVYITIHCDGEGEAGQCDVAERYSYLNYLGDEKSTNLTDLDIISAKGEKSVFAFEDDPRARSPFTTFLWAVLLLALGGGGVYLFMRYKERREYFGNFNLDDGEVDDMYDMYDLESGNLPPLATTGGNPVREDNHFVIHDAVIEMEE